ncbi:immunoglobulin-like domain-containing protein [Enterococcus quebecensis]|uniref:Bacterial Ig domain-containing protein n=1 Tax=Enterococcus quebecensis TaxID=903983 RepID=A0A1E5H3Y0_9ENTE|nr:immunoglobulin-like domain-containing protein [Enterococcus quebecensis]OEG19604.1 hypothetical protein BCR23_02625 [Enterococcus quebecensis]OJG75115.1 hypothetical protein RV12_GL001720 [Enterococcus quebecensis]
MYEKKLFVIGSIFLVSSSFCTPLSVLAEETLPSPIELNFSLEGKFIPDSFTLNIDEYVTGEVTGKKIKRVELHINDEFVDKTRPFSDGTFELDAKNLIKQQTDKVEVIAFGSQNGNDQIQSQLVPIIVEEMILTVNDFTLHDNSISGTAGNRADSVSLFVDDELLKTVDINNDETFTIPLDSDEITGIEDSVTIVSSLMNKELTRTTVTINPFDLRASIDDFLLGESTSISGKLSGNGLKKAHTVRLYVNKKRRGDSQLNSNTSFVIKARNFIKNLNDTVTIAILDKNEKELARYNIAVISPQEKDPAKQIKEWFPDPNFASAVARYLRKPIDSIVTKEDLASGPSEIFHGAYNKIKSIESIQYLARVTSFSLEHNDIEDLTPFTKADKYELLRSFYLSHNRIKDITPICELLNIDELPPRLINLHLDFNQLDNNAIKALAKTSAFDTLIHLTLNNNHIDDFSDIADGSFIHPYGQSEDTTTPHWSARFQYISLPKQQYTDSFEFEIPAKNIHGSPMLEIDKNGTTAGWRLDGNKLIWDEIGDRVRELIVTVVDRSVDHSPRHYGPSVTYIIPIEQLR